MTQEFQITGGLGFPVEVPAFPEPVTSLHLPAIPADSFVAEAKSFSPNTGFQVAPNRLFAPGEVVHAQAVSEHQIFSLGFEPSWDFPDFPPALVTVADTQGDLQVVILERVPVWQALDVLLGQGFPDRVVDHLLLTDHAVVLLARESGGCVLAYGVLESKGQFPVFFARAYARNRMDPSCTFKGVFPVLAAYYLHVQQESLKGLPGTQRALYGIEPFILKAMRTKGQKMGLEMPVSSDGIYEGRDYQREVPVSEARALLDLLPFKTLQTHQLVVTGTDISFFNNFLTDDKIRLLNCLTTPKFVKPTDTQIDDRLMDVQSALKILQQFKTQPITSDSQNVVEALAMVVLQNLVWILGQTDSWLGIRLLAQKVAGLFSLKDREKMPAVEVLCNRVESLVGRTPSYRSHQDFFEGDFDGSEISITPEILMDEGPRQELGFQLFLLSRGYPALARTIGSDLRRGLANPETRKDTAALIHEIRPLAAGYQGRPFMHLPEVTRSQIKKVTPLQGTPATIRPLSKLWIPRNLFNVRIIPTRPVG